MPAAIVDVLASRAVRAALENDPAIDRSLVAELGKNAACMELGTLGPDLSYYESMTKGAADMLLSRSDKPMGVCIVDRYWGRGERPATQGIRQPHHDVVVVPFGSTSIG
jgi:hypothetical protein